MSGVTHEDVTASVIRDLEAGGPPRAVVTLLDHYGQELLGFLVAIARDVNDGHELYAELGEHLLRSIASFRGDASARTFAYSIAWNLVRQRRRRRRVEQKVFSGERITVAAADVPAADHTTTAPFLKTEVKERLRRARERLTPQEQSLLVLRVDRAMAWNDIAVVLGLEANGTTSARLRKRYERVVEKLRRFLDDEGEV